MGLSLRTLLAPLALAAAVAALPAADAHALGAMSIKETIAQPRAWVNVGSAPAETRVKAQIALKQGNIEGLLAKLDDIANPTSCNYGKWLTRDEMQAYTAPDEATVATVKAWLVANGIDEAAIQQPAVDWLEVSMPLAQMEALVNAQYAMYSHPDMPHAIPRALEYSLPQALHDVIDTIQPTTAFYRPMAPQVAANTTSAPHTPPVQAQDTVTCDPGNITPACIKAYYNVDWTPANRASVGVTGFLDYNASHADMAAFIAAYAPGVNDFGDISVYGGHNSGGSPPDGNMIEGNLDTQYSASLAAPNQAWFLAMGPASNDFDDQMSNLAIYLSSEYSPPTSVSTSYGGEEAFYDGAYLDRICNEFAKAGSMGVSIFFSSGDNGVAGNGETSCPSFFPLWPASCPYITAVGATQINSGPFTPGAGQPVEAAAWFGDNGGTGGGFSAHFPAPSYQTSDVAAYISSLGGQYAGQFNAAGRGYPDVALVGELYDVVVQGQVLQVLGTSASAPAWAALASVLNDYRASQGRAPLGFLNPLLYGAARAGLRDVVGQGTRGCGGNGFPATAGWDAATGLGSLDFGALRALV